MKIAYILPVSWGGIPHYTAECANAISKYADVVVIKPRDDNDGLFSEEIDLISVFKPLKLTKGNEKRAFSMQNIINVMSYNNICHVDKLRPDIIHFPGLYIHSSMFAKVHRLDKKYPTVITQHSVADDHLCSLTNRDFFQTLLWNINYIGNSFLNPEKTVVHTLENRESLIRNGIPSDKVAVIPHGAYSFFKKYTTNYGIKENPEPNTILYFGYILENKGVEYLINAASIISKEISDIRIIIAGEGDLSKYRKDIQNQSVFEIYNEFISNEKVCELFQRAQIIVMPYSYHQGHSGVIAIAFAFGKPVIVTNVGSLPKMAENCGLIIPSKDSIAIAEAVISLLKDDVLRKRLCENASNKGKEMSWDNIAKDYLKLYNTVINEFKLRNQVTIQPPK